jgi:hypothetical protein
LPRVGGPPVCQLEIPGALLLRHHDVAAGALVLVGPRGSHGDVAEARARDE